MIVLWGLHDDGPLAAAHQILLRMGAPVYFIDQRRTFDYTISIQGSTDDQGCLKGPNGTLDLASVSALYLRQYDFSRFEPYCGMATSSPEWRAACEFEGNVVRWAEVFDGRLLNRPSAMGSNSSKPYQLELIPLVWVRGTKDAAHYRSQRCARLLAASWAGDLQVNQRLAQRRGTAHRSSNAGRCERLPHSVSRVDRRNRLPRARAR